MDEPKWDGPKGMDWGRPKGGLDPRVWWTWEWIIGGADLGSRHWWGGGPKGVVLRWADHGVGRQ